MTDFQRHRSRNFFVALLLVAVTLAIYWPVRHYNFVDYDDNSYVFENPDVTHGLSWWGVTWAFVDQHAGNWHPLTWLSHQLDCQMFGVNAGPMHLENVLIHCANSVLLLLLLNSMTRAFWRSAFVAALFALHPLRVESVAWISERKDVLSGFFFMLTLWFYILYAKKIGSDRSPVKTKSVRAKIFYRLSLAVFVLGLLSKSMLVTVPLILLLLDFWPLKRVESCKLKFSGSQIEQPSTFNLQLVIEKWPFFFFAFAIGVINLLSQHKGGGWVHAKGTIFMRPENIIVNYFSYIEKLLWPRNLSFLYLRPETISVSKFILAAFVFAGISAIAAIDWRRHPWFTFGWLWFVIILLPVCGIFELARLSIADRYTYLPSIGFYLMLTWTFAGLSKKLFPQRISYFANAIAAAVILIFCARLTREQIPVWQNTQTLMEHALKIDPNNPVAKQNLHIYLFEKAHPKLTRRWEINPRK